MSWNISQKALIFLSLISDAPREHLLSAAFSESSAFRMCLIYCAHMADLLEAFQTLGLRCGGCSPPCTFPVTEHSSAFADRDGGPGQSRKKHNELDGPHSVLCTLSSIYISLKCRWPYLITFHAPFYWYDPLRAQNSVKSRPIVCSATVF